jgi:phenylalanyl-tRNA synthetase beta chain
VVEEGPPIETLTSIKILDPNLGPRYSARIIQGIKVCPSPDWMRLRLEAAGLRAINNVVDVTNYVMLEMGHPMHAFDFNLLEEGRIEVRCGKTGDTFTTLDEMDRRLDDRMLLICDGRRGVALAGVMGGLNSEIRDDTKDLFLESAYFDPINTRRTSSLLNLSTDSSKRFERGADPNATVRALDMAASMIQELAGGKVAKGVADAYPEPIEPWQVELRPQRVKAILGVDVPEREMKNHLVHLGCEVKGKDPFNVTVPTFRPDLEREIDLIEEVARLHGYDKVPSADRAAISFAVAESPAEVFQNRLVDYLVKLGFSQSVTSPMIAEKEAGLPGHPQTVKIRNPGSEDMAVLRNGLLPGLLKATAHNINRDMPDLRLFEIGRVFCQDGAAQKEWDAVGGVLVGIHEPERWDQVKSEVRFLDVKGVVELLLAEFSLDKLSIIYYNKESNACYTADSATLSDGEKLIGIFGQVHPGTTAVFDIEVPIFAFEIDISALHGAATERRTYHAFPKYPALQRDLAFVVEEKVTAGDMQQSILEAGGENLERCELFDVYRSKQIGDDKKSLAFRLSFQSAERTLTDEEGDDFIRSIISAVEQKFGAKLRS